MDRVGVERTTSAAAFSRLLSFYLLSKVAAAIETELTAQIPLAPLFFFLNASEPCTVKRSFEKPNYFCEEVAKRTPKPSGSEIMKSRRP
jgi:hypothetical protein